MQINPDQCCECTSFRWWIGSSRANSAQSYNYPFRVFPFHALVISHAEIVVSNKDIISHNLSSVFDVIISTLNQLGKRQSLCSHNPVAFKRLFLCPLCIWLGAFSTCSVLMVSIRVERLIENHASSSQRWTFRENNIMALYYGCTKSQIFKLNCLVGCLNNYLIVLQLGWFWVQLTQHENQGLVSLAPKVYFFILVSEFSSPASTF